MREEKLRASGLSPEDAERRARERFGDVRTVAHDCVEIDIETIRAERREDMASSLMQDVRNSDHSYSYDSQNAWWNIPSLIFVLISLRLEAEISLTDHRVPL